MRHVLRHLQRVGLGGAGRQGDQVEDEALVLVGQKAGGQPHEQERQHRHDAGIGDHGRPACAAGTRPCAAGTSCGNASKLRLNQAKKKPCFCWPSSPSTGLSRVAQSDGRQHQRHHDGQRHGRDDGDRELAVDHAGRAAEEGHGQEHRGQHQADADQGAGDFLHALEGGVAGRQPFLMHDALDILHHHDGVVDQKADHQHQREQGERVDGIADRGQHAEGAQQHHRHGDGGNQAWRASSAGRCTSPAPPARWLRSASPPRHGWKGG